MSWSRQGSERNQALRYHAKAEYSFAAYLSQTPSHARGQVSEVRTL